jgi:hypothetical protein
VWRVRAEAWLIETNLRNGGSSVAGAETAEDCSLEVEDLFLAEGREDCRRATGFSRTTGDEWRDLVGVRAGSGEVDFGGGLCSGLRRMKEAAATVGGGETG